MPKRINRVKDHLIMVFTMQQVIWEILKDQNVFFPVQPTLRQIFVTIQFQLDPALVYCISINAIEIVVEIVLFGLFYSDSRKGEVGKGLGGGFSLLVGIGFLFFGLGRVWYILHEFISPNFEFWFVGSCFIALATLLIFSGFLRVIESALSLSRRLTPIIFALFPVAILLFFASQFFSAVFLITGITHLIPEMTRSEEKVEVIQQKGTKILLKYGRYVNVALITQKDLQILHTKLDTFITEFEFLYKHVLPEWNGNVDVFIPTLAMAEKFFM